MALAKLFLLLTQKDVVKELELVNSQNQRLSKLAKTHRAKVSKVWSDVQPLGDGPDLFRELQAARKKAVMDTDENLL